MLDFGLSEWTDHSKVGRSGHQITSLYLLHNIFPWSLLLRISSQYWQMLTHAPEKILQKDQSFFQVFFFFFSTKQHKCTSYFLHSFDFFHASKWTTYQHKLLFSQYSLLLLLKIIHLFFYSQHVMYIFPNMHKMNNPYP